MAAILVKLVMCAGHFAQLLSYTSDSLNTIIIIRFQAIFTLGK